MDNEFVVNVNGELTHWGIKGMRWGVRRYQNKDGSLTAAGKKRYDGDTDINSERNRKIAKRVAAAVVMTATVSAAAAVYAKNPEAVNQLVSKIGNKTVSSLKNGSSKTISAGKKYMDEIYGIAKKGVKEVPGTAKKYGKTAAKKVVKGIKDGIKEGIEEAPKKATKAVITGATMMAAKRILDSQVGKEEAARIFQANNNKKISSFWKVGPEDKDDDE